MSRDFYPTIFFTKLINLGLLSDMLKLQFRRDLRIEV